MTPLVLLSLAHAQDPEALVGFSPGAERVAVELRWFGGGSGFPHARVFVFDTATGATLADAQVRLGDAASARGIEGASADARAAAGDVLAGVDFAAAPAPVDCAEGTCGPLTVTVRSTPTAQNAAACGGRADPELLTLVVGERTVVDERVPAVGCPSAWAAERAWIVGDRALLLIAFRVPGFEGYAPGVAPVPLRIP